MAESTLQLQIQMVSFVESTLKRKEMGVVSAE